MFDLVSLLGGDSKSVPQQLEEIFEFERTLMKVSFILENNETKSRKKRLRSFHKHALISAPYSPSFMGKRLLLDYHNYRLLCPTSQVFGVAAQ